MKLVQRNFLLPLFLLTILTNVTYAQNSVGIGVANPNKNAVLELISPNNNQGLLIPKLTTAQRTATSFTSALTTKENGLMVFDSDESKFYYWAATDWKIFGTGDELTGGNGITITNNTISTVPQDLKLTGTTLSITNNPSATTIDLAPFSGTNTDDQTLTYNTTTGALSITKITGGPQSVTLTTAGTAGGDLTGTYPNPTVANNAINSAKIADGTITGADILDGTVATADIAADAITSAKILNATITGADVAANTIASGNILDNTIANTDLAASSVNSSNIIDATITGADVAANTIASGNILDNTIANADLATSSVNSSNIIDATITGADVAANTIASANILDNTIANADLATSSVNSSNIIDGTIGTADVADNSITSLKILDGAIADADISSTANINTTKLSVGTAGQVLTTSGGQALWANPSGTTLINNAGTANLFAGLNVGSPISGTDGTDNAFYGFTAGAPNTSGDYNVEIGSHAGYRNVAGNLNVLIGWYAGSATTTSGFSGDTMIGAQAGEKTVDGPNTFIGEKAGQNNTTGTFNTFVGNRTGSISVTGTQNTLLGYQADISADPVNNATAIGYQAVVDASNKVRIGNASVTVIQGQVNFTAASDRRLKSNIQSLTAGLDLINKLKPVSYNMKNMDDNRTNWGFIAQDIEELVGTTNAILTIGNDKNRTLGLRYTDFVAPLVKAVQEQQQEIEDLNSKVETLTAELEQIKKMISLLGLKADNKK